MTELEDPLISLAAELGFVETDELRAKRAEVVQLLRSGHKEVAREQLSQYSDLSHELIDQLEEGEPRFKAQIALIAVIASIWQSGGYHSEFLENLNAAVVYSSNMNYQDTEERLLAESLRP
jgi:hypothetical protein